MNCREKYIAFKTILIKEVLRFARIWIQTILPPVITTALYFVIFGRLIGPQIGSIHGYAYMDYIVPAYDAGDTVDQKSTISDDGTTFTKGEIGSGP